MKRGTNTESGATTTVIPRSREWKTIPASNANTEVGSSLAPACWFAWPWWWPKDASGDASGLISVGGLALSGTLEDAAWFSLSPAALWACRQCASRCVEYSMNEATKAAAMAIDVAVDSYFSSPKQGLANINIEWVSSYFRLVIFFLFSF